MDHVVDTLRPWLRNAGDWFVTALRIVVIVIVASGATALLQGLIRRFRGGSRSAWTTPRR